MKRKPLKTDPPSLPMEPPAGSLSPLAGGLIGLDASGRVVQANPAALALLKIGPDDLLGRPLSQVLPATAEGAARSLSSGTPSWDWEVTEPSGRWIVDLAPLARGQEPGGLVCRFRPTEELSGLEDRLTSHERLKQQLEAIINLSSDGLWVSDGEGRVLRVNDASERLNGLKAADVVGRNLQGIVDQGLVDSSVTLRVLATRGPVHMLQYVSRTRKHLLVTGTPLFGTDGRIDLVVVNERDLTELNKVKHQLDQAREVSEKIKDELRELSLRELIDEPLVAESPEFKAVLKTALKLARTGVSNILLLGESGTGKGLVAKHIHNHGVRRDQPFIQINCAALPETLFEAELFGYEKGAFTGAREQGKAGLFELAQGGTLFLDEIGELPLTIQAKLLKYLDDQTVLRLGGNKPTRVDCTIIAATNQDLESRSRTGSFRRDLLYRLNTFTIRIPPLRERPEDIFELARLFLETCNQRYGLKRRITSRGLSRLQKYPFPGNVRELKSLVKKTVVMSESEVLDGDLVEGLGGWMESRPEDDAPASRRALNQAVWDAEEEALKAALARCGSTRAMAGLLGVSQPTVVRKLKRHGLRPPMIQK